MADENDDLSPEDIEALEKADDETKARLRKLSSWLDRKKTPSSTSPASDQKPDQWTDPPLSVLKKLAADPETRSILTHLFQTPLPSPDKGKKSAASSGAGDQRKPLLKLL